MSLGRLGGCPVMAADASGAAVLVGTTAAGLRVALREPGGGWGAPVTIAASGVFDLEAAVSPRGDAVVGWTEWVAGTSRVRAVAAPRAAGSGHPRTSWAHGCGSSCRACGSASRAGRGRAGAHRREDRHQRRRDRRRRLHCARPVRRSLRRRRWSRCPRAASRCWRSPPTGARSWPSRAATVCPSTTASPGWPSGRGR